MTLKYLYLLLFIFIIPAGSQANETRYYDVEVIIYENMNSLDRQSEHWPTSVNREIPEYFIELNGPIPEQLKLPGDIIADLSFRKLPTTAYQLAEEARLIDESPSRRVLLHAAWVQPGLPDNNTVNVHLNQPFNFADHVSMHQQNYSDSLPATSIPVSGTLDALIRISLARYLHVESDLLLTYSGAAEQEVLSQTSQYMGFAVDTEEATDEKPALPSQYHIKLKRNRIRSTELHYLDHPLLGMLILFTPHEVIVKEKASKK